MPSTGTTARLLAYACLALSMTLVGIYVGASPLLVAVFPVTLLSWLRFGLSAVAMAGWLMPREADAELTRREHGLLFLQSFLGNFLFTLCALQGAALTGAVTAGVAMAAIPATVAILSRVFLRETLSPRVWIAVACSGCAVAVLALRHRGDPGRLAEQPEPLAGNLWALMEQGPWWGYLLLMTAVLCEASYMVIGKRLSASVSPKRVTAIINVWGLALSTPMGVAAAWQFDFARVDTATWALLGFYAITASMVTVWLWMRGLRHVPAQQAGVFAVFLPVSAAAVGVFALGEPWGMAHAAALLLAVAAVWMVTRQAPADPRTSR